MPPSRGRRRDAIHLVESAYRPAASDAEWLNGVVESVQPLLDHGMGVAGVLYDVRGRDVGVDHSVNIGMNPVRFERTLALMRAAPDDMVDKTFRAVSGFGSASTLTGLGAAIEQNPIWQEVLHPVGVHDALAVGFLTDPSGLGCVLMTPTSRVEVPSGQTLRTWAHLTAHLSAGLRLSRALRVNASPDGGEAVLAPDGRVEHAEGPARQPRALEHLRRAAMAIDRARGRLRHQDPALALRLWRGLVAGRWSLVDHFERSGRRYLVARRNPPGVRDPRALSESERQVAWYASLGHANKLIAYTLGISLSAVALHLSQARLKLRLKSRSQLIGLMRGLLAGGKGN